MCTHAYSTQSVDEIFLNSSHLRSEGLLVELELLGSLESVRADPDWAKTSSSLSRQSPLLERDEALALTAGVAPAAAAVAEKETVVAFAPFSPQGD